LILAGSWVRTVGNSFHRPRSSLLSLQDPAVQPHLDARVGAFVLEQLDNLLRTVVAEELPVFPLVPRDAVSLDQREEILRRAARESGLQEVRAAAGDVVRGRGAEVGEIAASAAGDENLVSEPRLVFEHENPPSAQAGHPGTEKPCGTPAHNDDLVVQPAQRFRKSIGKASHESIGANPHRAFFNYSATDHTGLGLDAFEMLTVKNGKFTLYKK
jgi:hypothetical protein